jgi:hypothetical protein
MLMYWYVLVASKISSEIYIFDSGHLSTGHCIYLKKDVRIFGYLSKPKGAREQKRLGNTTPYSLSRIICTRFGGNDVGS